MACLGCGPDPGLWPLWVVACFFRWARYWVVACLGCGLFVLWARSWVVAFLGCGLRCGPLGCSLSGFMACLGCSPSSGFVPVWAVGQILGCGLFGLWSFGSWFVGLCPLRIPTRSQTTPFKACGEDHGGWGCDLSSPGGCLRPSFLKAPCCEQTRNCHMYIYIYREREREKDI